MVPAQRDADRRGGAAHRARRSGRRRAASRSKAGCAITTRRARVTRLDYQAYGPLADDEGEAILDEARAKFAPARRALRASHRRARDRRDGGLGRRQRRSSRRRVRRVPLDHRRGEAARADLEERALRRRRDRLAASGQHAGRYARRALTKPRPVSSGIAATGELPCRG